MTNIYEEIKDNFNSINYTNIESSKSPIINTYNEAINGNNYFLESEMTNYTIKKKKKLEIIFEDGDIKKPKIVGTFINKNRPKKWVIDVYSKTGQDCGRSGWRVTG